MTQISLVLPFAIPPLEIAPDLIRALADRAPALANLTTRTASRRHLAPEPALRTLPYESWLARELGVSGSGAPAFAAQVMRRFGLEADGGTWFMVAPGHIEIARSHLLLHDARTLQLCEADSRVLFETAKPYFDDSGKTLLYGDAATWFMRADDWGDLATASPDAVIGMNMADCMPLGARAVAYRKLQNEIQMLWFEHPVNAGREARGLAAINGFWPWGAATQAVEIGAALAATAAPAWLAALVNRPAASVDALLGAHEDADAEADAMLVCGELIGPALASDWSSWLAQIAHLEHTVFMPALNALRAGRVRRVRLVLSHRSEQLDLTTTRLSLRAFWRSPTLNSLLP